LLSRVEHSEIILLETSSFSPSQKAALKVPWAF
jgi:hypothetical protein